MVSFYLLPDSFALFRHFGMTSQSWNSPNLAVPTSFGYQYGLYRATPGAFYEHDFGNIRGLNLRMSITPINP